MFVNESSTNSSEHSISANFQGNSLEYIASLVALSIIIVVGIIGNSIVVMVIVMVNTMRTTTNILLLNVAVADIITLLLTAIHVVLSNAMVPASSFMCKVIGPNTLSNVALLATGLTLTVLSVERYNALVKPLRVSRRLTSDNVLYAIIVIWVVSMVMAMPMLIYLDYDPRSQSCTPGDNLKSLLISVGCIVFSMTIIPFLVIAFSYSQIVAGLYFSNTIWSSNNPGISREDLVAKRKLVKLLVTVTVIFFIAFVPYGVLQILKFSLDGKKNQKQLVENLKNLTFVIKYLMPLHSSINPFLYTLQSQNYRDGFMVVARKILCRGPRLRHRASNTRESSAVLFTRNGVTF